MSEGIPENSLNRTGKIVGASTSVGFSHLVEKLKSVVDSEGAYDEEFFQKNSETIFETVNELKGVPLKVAQLLSLDDQIVPVADCSKMAKSHHSVSPLGYSMVRQSFLRNFDAEPEEIFESFDQDATCAASIGQVHKASHDGTDYAVKIKYPGIETTFESDLRFLKPMLRVLGFTAANAQNFTSEISDRIVEEADYLFELRRAVEITTACRGKIPNVNFPQYYPDTSSKEIITMDWVDGVTLDVFLNSSPDQATRDKIGQALLDFTVYQIEALQTFHADPNPGNYLVKDDQIWVVDFGCTKKISKETFRTLFTPLCPGILESDDKLASSLLDLAEDFNESHYDIMVTVGRDVVEIISRPIRHEGKFNFGDPEYIKEIFGAHHNFIKDPQLRRGLGFSSSPDAIFLTRTWLGLFRLLARVGARVDVALPAWMNDTTL